MAALATDMKIAKPKSPGASGLAIPRFVSLASNTVHMRAGPGVRYPITWIYRRLGTPLMVMAEHEYWRKVRDAEGNIIADRIDVYFGKDTRRVRVVVARGNVKIINEGNVTYSEKAIYLVEQGRVVLPKRPKLVIQREEVGEF